MMDMNTKILFTAVCVVLVAVKSFGQYGNRYMIQRGIGREFDGFDQGKYSSFVQPYTHPIRQGYNLGWNGYQGVNVFNPYQKPEYHHGYQNHGFGGGLGFADGGQLFGVHQPANFIGNQRIRL